MSDKGVRTFRGDGDVFPKLVELFRTIASETESTNFRMGTVVSRDPIEIRVDGSGRILVGDDLTIAERLTEHKRAATIPGDVGEVEITFEPAISAGDRVILLSYATEYGPEYVVLDKAVKAVRAEGSDGD